MKKIILALLFLSLAKNVHAMGWLKENGRNLFGAAVVTGTPNFLQTYYGRAFGDSYLREGKIGLGLNLAAAATVLYACSGETPVTRALGIGKKGSSHLVLNCAANAVAVAGLLYAGAKATESLTGNSVVSVSTAKDAAVVLAGTYILIKSAQKAYAFVGSAENDEGDDE